MPGASEFELRRRVETMVGIVSRTCSFLQSLNAAS
jgi:hypothetical protein